MHAVYSMLIPASNLNLLATWRQLQRLNRLNFTNGTYCALTHPIYFNSVNRYLVIVWVGWHTPLTGQCILIMEYNFISYSFIYLFHLLIFIFISYKLSDNMVSCTFSKRKTNLYLSFPIAFHFWDSTKALLAMLLGKMRWLMRDLLTHKYTIKLFVPQGVFPAHLAILESCI